MKSLTLCPIGGLANRLYSINSAIAFCTYHNIYLSIYWFKDSFMGAGFHDLFNLDSRLKRVKVIDGGIPHMLMDYPRRRNLWLSEKYQKYKFDKSFYCIDPKDKINEDYLLSCFEKNDNIYLVIYTVFSSLSINYGWIFPNERIQSCINKKKEEFARNTIGLHIRRTDQIDSIKYSPTELFIGAMHNEIKKDSEVKFFVASDSQEEKQRLVKEFGESRLISEKKNVRRDNKEGIERAVVDLYLLANTNKIYGSDMSTFSTYSSNILGTDLIILSIKE